MELNPDDSHHVRRDMQLLEVAIKDERFDIPDELLKLAPQLCAQIMARGSERAKLRALSLLVAMVNSNKPKVQQHLHAHQAAYDVMRTTLSSEQDLDERKRNLSERLARLDRLGH